MVKAREKGSPFFRKARAIASSTRKAKGRAIVAKACRWIERISKGINWWQGGFEHLLLLWKGRSLAKGLLQEKG